MERRRQRNGPDVRSSLDGQRVFFFFIFTLAANEIILCNIKLYFVPFAPGIQMSDILSASSAGVAMRSRDRSSVYPRVILHIPSVDLGSMCPPLEDR